MAARIEFRGLQQVQRALAQLGANAPQGLARALHVEAEEIMGRSKAEFVPVDTGVLRSSGFVDASTIQGTQVSVTMGYGGAAAAYAVVQHERLDFQHGVGGPKYLERPVLQAVSGMPQRLVARLKAEKLAG